MTRKEELKRKVNARIDNLVELTIAKWGKSGVVYPSVTYNLKGNVGGKASYLREEIMVNYYLLDKYENDYIKNTIGHEYAHLVAFKYFGWKGVEGKPHGRAWKAVMHSFELDPKRCHNYETKPARKTRSRTCHCNVCHEEFKVGSIRYNRIRKGGRNYVHKNCGGTIEAGAAKVF